jgi:hypothetical protein
MEKEIKKEFIQFHLKKVGIELWDSQLRIAHYRLNHPNYQNQYGGGMTQILTGYDEFQIRNLLTILLK